VSYVTTFYSAIEYSKHYSKCSAKCNAIISTITPTVLLPIFSTNVVAIQHANRSTIESAKLYAISTTQRRAVYSTDSEAFGTAFSCTIKPAIGYTV